MSAEADKLANEILTLSRNKLLVNLRFLDVALSYHKREAYDGSFSTNGKTIFYNPAFILQSYKNSQEETVRMYLHMILHCLFHHPFIGPAIDVRLWSLACDMAVECTINDLGLSGVSSSKESKQKQIVSELKKDLKILTAEKIYSTLKKGDYPDWALQQWEAAFVSDDHKPWYIWLAEKKSASQSSSAAGKDGTPADKDEASSSMATGMGSEADEADSPSTASSCLDSTEMDLSNIPDVDSESSDTNKSPSTPDLDSELSDTNKSSSAAENKEFWEQVSNQIQMDLETFSKTRGDMAGNMMQNLRSVNREKYDYTEFLKKFAVLGEVMKVNEDEFDYIYYTYGLEHYDNMPFIEPLEYKEVKRVKEFVIAIDTSGSVAGEEVQMFLQKTYNILMQEDSYFSRVNLHIIQCDAEIQQAVVIKNRDEFEDYLKTMELYGFGGTDFRPVFRYVDQLIEEKRFRNLKGMIYFTDGYGVFPEHKPDYTTAFVFVRNEYAIPEVPPWAIKLVLQHEDIIAGI